MGNEEVYKNLLARVIENEKLLYGNAAVAIARQSSKLKISDDGRVLTMPADFNQAFLDLAAEYGKLDGVLSLRFIKSILEAYKASFPGVELPNIDSLLPEKM